MKPAMNETFNIALAQGLIGFNRTSFDLESLESVVNKLSSNKIFALLFDIPPEDIPPEEKKSLTMPPKIRELCKDLLSVNKQLNFTDEQRMEHMYLVFHVLLTYFGKNEELKDIINSFDQKKQKNIYVALSHAYKTQNINDFKALMETCNADIDMLGDEKFTLEPELIQAIDIENLRGYSKSLSWFRRLFFPKALMTALDQFNPYENGGTFKAVYDATQKSSGIFNWLGRRFLSGYALFVNSETTKEAFKTAETTVVKPKPVDAAYKENGEPSIYPAPVPMMSSPKIDEFSKNSTETAGSPRPPN